MEYRFYFVFIFKGTHTNALECFIQFTVSGYKILIQTYIFCHSVNVQPFTLEQKKYA